MTSILIAWIVKHSFQPSRTATPSGPPHNRHHAHPLPHRSPRCLQPVQPSLEARAIVPLAHSCRCTRQRHGRSVEAAGPHKQGRRNIRRQVQYVPTVKTILETAVDRQALRPLGTRNDSKARGLTHGVLEDGKEMNLNLSNMRITEVMEQVDRHSRMLARKEELNGN